METYNEMLQLSDFANKQMRLSRPLKLLQKQISKKQEEAKYSVNQSHINLNLRGSITQHRRPGQNTSANTTPYAKSPTGSPDLGATKKSNSAYSNWQMCTG
jgi:hypothetical protein